MRGRIGKGLPTISFTRKPSLRQPEQRAMAFPRPAHPPAPATPLRPGAGKKTDRSVAQAGPDVAEQRTKQEIRDQKHFGRSTVEAEKIFLAGKTITKSISDTRDFSPRSFYTRPFHNTKGVAGSLSAKTAPRSHLAFGTQTARGVRRAADGDKKVNGRDFAGNRPFLGQGKSQKSLNRQNPPLTIEQVRELLNKNK